MCNKVLSISSSLYAQANFILLKARKMGHFVMVSLSCGFFFLTNTRFTFETVNHSILLKKKHKNKNKNKNKQTKTKTKTKNEKNKNKNKNKKKRKKSYGA